MNVCGHRGRTLDTKFLEVGAVASKHIPNPFEDWLIFCPKDGLQGLNLGKIGALTFEEHVEVTFVKPVLQR
jgi:hypothetical protein